MCGTVTVRCIESTRQRPSGGDIYFAVKSILLRRDSDLLRLRSTFQNELRYCYALFLLKANIIHTYFNYFVLGVVLKGQSSKSLDWWRFGSTCCWFGSVGSQSYPCDYQTCRSLIQFARSRDQNKVGHSFYEYQAQPGVTCLRDVRRPERGALCIYRRFHVNYV